MMMIQFVWKDEYSVGDPEIDMQHKGMFDLGNALPDVLEAQDVRPLIMRLYKYTRIHFTAEEKMMKEVGFPLLSEHRELHEELISKLVEVSSTSFDSDASISGFKMFVYEWLIDHILYQDMKYFEYNQE